MRTWMLVVALGALVPSARAQGSDGPRWSGWLGCWNVRMDATRGANPAADAPPDTSRAPRVCVAAEGDGATITTEMDGKPGLTQQLVADGTERPFSDGGCTGSQQVSWSADRHRLFSRARLTCAGGTTRTVSGVSLLAPDRTWIEAQAIEVGGRSSVRVRRFVREDRNRATQGDVHRLTVDDVKEASAHVAGPAIEAALVESQSTFALTARRLLDLDAAGVPGSVIDVMVALTYPQAFTLRPASRADRLTPFPFDVDSSDPTYAWWLPTYAEAGGYFDSAYFMSPFGYSYLGTYPVIFGVQDGGFGGGGGGGGGGRADRGTREGRVVNGLGYTRLAPREAQPASGGSDTSSSARSGSSGTASTRGYTRGAEPASGSSSSGGSSAGSSGGGSSSGSSAGSSDGGRTAVDR